MHREAVMGIRGEIFSSKLVLDRRTFFFNVKENRMGAKFLNLVESRKGSGEEFERTQIMIYEEDVSQFMRELEKAVSMLRSAAGGSSGHIPSFEEHRARQAERDRPRHSRSDDGPRTRQRRPDDRGRSDEGFRGQRSGRQRDDAAGPGAKPLRVRRKTSDKPGAKAGPKSGAGRTTGKRPVKARITRKKKESSGE